jgi:hypothetical protein
MNIFKEYSQSQGFLLPLSLDEFVPAEEAPGGDEAEAKKRGRKRDQGSGTSP